MAPFFSKAKPILIDGSFGEGGGQILRTALALSCVSGKPVEIVNIRKSRPKPGLQPQHLLAVKAAAKISNATIEGAGISSTAIRFHPGEITGGEYRFDVSEIKGSAGSTSLVLQTILLPLIFAGQESAIRLIGGTHVPWSPSFHYLRDVFLPVLFRMGVTADLIIEKWGWYPLGGGSVIARIKPRRELPGITMTERGKLKSVRGRSTVSNLPMEIAVRQRNRALTVLSREGVEADIETASAPSLGKGTHLILLAQCENSVAAFDSLGALGKRAETVADEASGALLDYLQSGAAIDPHLADQLIPYCSLADGISKFTTSRITLHLLTNVRVVRQFVDIDIAVEGKEGEPGSVQIGRSSDGAGGSRRHCLKL